MQKARRQIEEKLPVIDIIYEIRDARIPESSRNPLLMEMVKGKPILVILNKSDLADPALTKQWVEYYEERGLHCLALNSLTGNVFHEINQKTQLILQELKEKEAKKGMRPRPFRAMVIGIPNVGKSQFINNMAGKNKVKTGNLPGVTKNQSFIKTKGDLLLLDNPGVLWPKFDDESIGFHLALLGSIKDEILPLDEVALFGIRYLVEHYPERIIDRYRLDLESAESMVAILDQIGTSRGCKLSGGLIDYDRVINLFLYDIRNSKLGRLTLETTQDVSI
ncbi:MAG: ribosome biogenesis GTPase YlqF [Bacilli bacterium]|nr:ribosome biogenesis GTPase YlqF [Bacilli bacterium]MBN2876643.1 ribosome biogenesis GTPase YlqF [Bacilli bacterium]